MIVLSEMSDFSKTVLKSVNILDSTSGFFWAVHQSPASSYLKLESKHYRVGCNIHFLLTKLPHASLQDLTRHLIIKHI